MHSKEKPTQRQSQVLAWIGKFIQKNGYSPTVREIGNGMGISSPNGVKCHLSALTRKGLIRCAMQNGRALGRTMEVIG